MSKIAIVYGSSTGATEAIAQRLQALLDKATLFNAENTSVDDLIAFDFLIFGASTTGVGDLQDDWEILLPKVEKMNFTGKKVALFALGDSASFSTSFAGALFPLYNALVDNVEIVGSVSTDGYTFEDSYAVINGRFVGLALDEDNEYELTEGRMNEWVAELKKHMS